MTVSVALRPVRATRYVTPLREGGSLPGLVEADDDGLYVVKFRGAGQGPRALAAEVIVGELARGLGLPVPDLVSMELDPRLGAAEPDPEIQELITASVGDNLGVDFLPGALTYSPAGTWQPDPELAAEIVWLDALTTNVDRTPRNLNLLIWHDRLWLIDHGAALYRQHRGLDGRDDAPIIDGLNAAWASNHHGATLIAADPGITAAGSRDDAFPLWLNDRSPAATDFVQDYLYDHSATGNTYNIGHPATAGPSRTLAHSGLEAIYVGAAAARYFGVPASDPRHPDVWGVVQHGVVYTGKTKKIAEHGGADIEDRHVALLVYAPGAEHGVRSRVVGTTSIAPSILSLLGLDPGALGAVRIEGTPTLPGLR